MSYILLEKPYTAEYCRAQTNQHVVGIVQIPLQSIIDTDFEGFLDILEHAVLGDIGILTDLEYDVVGNGMNDTLHIRVTGFADLVGDE